MASIILKNNSLGEPTNFCQTVGHLPGQWTRGQNWAGQAAGEKGGPPSVKVAHIYVNRRYMEKYKSILPKSKVL